MMYHKADTSPH